MLQTIRKKTTSLVFKIFLFILIIGFALWGLESGFSGGAGQKNVAKIGDVKISQRQLNNLIDEKVKAFQSQVSDPTQIEFAKQFAIPQASLSELINKTVFDITGEEYGIVIPESVIKDRIYQIPAFQSFGKFNKDLYERYLLSQGVQEKEIIDNVQFMTRREILLNSILIGLTPPDSMEENRTRFANQEREISYIQLNYSDEEVPEPSNDQLALYYNNNKQNYVIPEYRSITYLDITPQTIAKGITIPEADVKAEYESRIAEYTEEGKRQINQMTFTDQQEAEKAYGKLSQGQTFDSVLKEFFPDIKKEEYELGWVVKGDLLDDISEDIFNLKKEGYSKPFEGILGWQIYKVVDIQEERKTPFEDVKKSLENGLAIEKAEGEIDQIADQIEEKLVDGQSIENIAKAFNIDVSIADKIDALGLPKNKDQSARVSKQKAFFDTVFSLEKGSDSGLEITPDENYFVARVDEIEPTYVKSFDEVKSEVKEIWIKEQQKESLQAKIEDVQKKIESEKSFKNASNQFKKEVKSLGYVNRQHSETSLPMGFIGAMFKVNPKSASYVPTENGAVLGFVENVKYVDTVSDEDKKRLNFSIMSELRNDILSAFMSEKKQEIGVELYYDNIYKNYPGIAQN